MHAQLVQRLTDAGVRGIGMDITMAEQDVGHPENDLAYAQAIQRNGHVVMPVFAEAAELGGVLEEALPTPDIARNTAAFGHVDASKDADGVTRGVYLKAGSFGLAHIDVVLYEAVAYAQNTVWDVLAPGGYLVYDDATEPTCPGATRAVEEMISKRNISLEQVYPHMVLRANLQSLAGNA